MQDYYNVLGVADDATQDVIRGRYRAIIQILSVNPARSAEFGSLAAINEAFRTLGDSRMRADYDRGRAPKALPPATDLAAAPAVPAPPEMAKCPFCLADVSALFANVPDSACPRCSAPLFSTENQARIPDARRTFDRLPFNLRVNFSRSAAPNEICRGISEDVSMGGMRIVTETPLAVGERLIVVCDFGAAAAIVRHVRRDADSPLYECGTQFLTLRVKQQRGALLSKLA